MSRRLWTDDEIEKLKQQYPDRETAVIARSLGRPIRPVYQKAASLGLRKSPEFLASTHSGRIQRGRTDARMMATQFKKGQEAWNKGAKGVCGTHENCRRTQFKKGHPPESKANYVPIGTERLSKDGYLERKVTDDPNLVPARRWIGVHRLVWEAAHGPIPPSHAVCFRPGRRTADAARITIDALELVSRAELARRNHPVTRDPELAKLVQLKGAITRQMNRIAREAKEKQS
jgi:hypothetical protein